MDKYDKWTVYVNKRPVARATRVPFHKAMWEARQLQSQVRGLSIEQDLDDNGGGAA